MTTLFVDPGTKKSGWALFVEADGKVWYKKSGVVWAKRRKDPWKKRCDSIIVSVIKQLQSSRDRYGSVELVVIELPRHYSGGVGEAAKNSGAILKMMFLIGALRQCLRERGYVVRLLPVQKWKGQVTDEIRVKRIKRAWGVDIDIERVDDELDAVGMADWWFRKKLKREVVKRG